MTQDTGPHEPDGGEPTPAAPDVAPDGALDLSLDGLDDLPLAEHVTRFTAVHDALRDRLDNPGHDDRPDTGPGVGD